ncbi:hypothetical protein A2733_01300 [Candidatus Nomurabacteria bacterium RIFCSPHIGHO2_01_FULL_40_20]|uniref:Major facilitator superfamily (MFS) profile domain-containing protein n=1 Tax=Candidatus Nomurabacteria bacterium RIFCSPHIGHO2_01_FULL_40_20 TaxID=1801738 RepID=A0A1F6V481_9BACT|nr:MAG: hypothetical protein A2733_01300 [Candidatus Nomurabacteria bacterium RIFCSPHIGHO2_01_FULL_40_20]
MNKKRLFLWCLYDFANSFVLINFLLYFGQWLVIDGGLSDFWYNAIFAITTIILLFSAPTLAAYTDKHGGRKFFLNIATFGTFISYSLVVLFAYADTPNIFLVALFFLLGQYFYQLSFVFFNPMIADIADEGHRARASGIGQSSNALGQICGLLVTLPLSASRLDPLIPAIGIFFVLALPMMILFKEERKMESGISLRMMKEETKIFKSKMFNFFRISIAAPMLVAFFFFNDALITASNNYSIYIERVFSVPDKTKSILLMGIILTGAIGGILGGWIADRIGALKTLKIILLGWVVILPAIALAPSFKMFFILTVPVGLLIGSMWAVTRAYMSTLLTKDDMGYGFSFYTLMERFATFVGPLAWGGTILFLGSEPSSYRLAMGILTIFVLTGFFILHFWKRQPTSEIVFSNSYE